MSRTVEQVGIGTEIVGVTFITDWLFDSSYGWPSQYGRVTNGEWLFAEAIRCPGTEVIESEFGMMALVRRVVE